jgi:hypothetical protein
MPARFAPERLVWRRLAMRIPALIPTAVVALAAAGAAQSHHSAVMFDHKHLMSMTGTVKTVDFGAPHSWFSIVVKPTGKAAVEWDLESEDTGQLRKAGLTRDTLKPGDQVTAAFYPLHDGRPAGQLVYLTANGKTYGDKSSLQMPPG